MRTTQFLVAGLFTLDSTLALSISAQHAFTPSSQTTITPPDTDSLLALHKTLITSQSITGNELEVGEFLTSYLESRNLTVERQQVSENRYNLYAYLGHTRATKVLLSSHIDTVPPFWPYIKKDDDGTIWGRGSVDAKGSVATQVIAFESLLAASRIAEGDVGLLYVVGEETGGEGMKAANDLGVSWDAVIFGEPTELKLASGHKGILGFELTAKGKAGHSGYPELGRNANLMLVDALYHITRAQYPSSEKYGNTTLNLGKIDGGVAANVIAEDAVAIIAIRIAAGEPGDIRKIVEKAVAKAGYGENDLVLDFSTGYGPVPIDHDVKGFESIVVNYGTDIPNLKGDHKKYLYGPGSILMAHSDHEHLTISDLETAVEGYKTLVLATLKV